ncbi:hypothetical protein [Bacillus sp. CGMCC 1.16541]|uniref:hypothetical protein n=1 Tax=Bacillus sp. CGMCC 1.16541 TaxID=2185143 RepID=UPI000D735A74|nr:hypothetical protein [Bacillus sp. CGMCC 1.16541]
MKRIMIGVFFLVGLIGCQSQLTYSEVEMTKANASVQEFMEFVKHENGPYLYLDGKKTMYLFLNGGNVVQGEKAIHFTDVKVKAENDTLNLFVTEDETDDYSNDSLTHQALYKIHDNHIYETIHLFVNGTETPFTMINGNE